MIIIAFIYLFIYLCIYYQITAVVTILENDEPGGTFSIASSSEGPFYIEVKYAWLF